MGGGFVAGALCGVLVAGVALVAASLLAGDPPGAAEPDVRLAVEPLSPADGAEPPDGSDGDAEVIERSVPVEPGGD